MMSYGIMQNKNVILVGIVALSFMNDGGGIGVEAVAAGRRRRRSIYNVRPCGPGQRAIWTPSKKKVSSCVSCEEGKYRGDTKHALEECMLCAGGRHSSDDLSYCIGDICKAGSFGVADTTECKMCSSGKYSLKDGMFSCKECESGRYVAEEGSKDCMGEMCPAGKWGVSGAVSQDSSGVCSPCEAGKYSVVGATTCLACPDGKYSRKGATVCIKHEKCGPAYYNLVVPRSDSPKISCERCIYSSEYYFAGFIFAAVVIGMNMVFFMSKSSFVPGCCLSIVPACWILFMNFCNSKRINIGWITAGFVMNSACLWPMCSAVKNKLSVAYNRYHNEQREKQSMQPQQLPAIVKGTVTTSCHV